ncbi:MAG: protein-disulfide reductase DsbD domain-containing protein [Pseudomonadota bacterium]
MNPIVAIVASLLLLSASLAVHASDQATTEQVQAQLIASVNAVHPGEKILLGVHQRIIPHWHTYWLNPGDSGIATTIAWTLPKGAVAGDIQWPIPSRFKLGSVTNYGYANDVTLLSPITVPNDLIPGGSFPISAKVNWLVCEEICIPQEVVLNTVLPVAATGEESGRGSPLIAIARANLPVASPWSIATEHNKNGVSLRIVSTALQSANVKDVWFYPSQWGKISHGAAQAREIDGDAVVLKLQPGDAPIKPDESLDGVLVVTERIGNETISRGFNVTANTAIQAVVEASSLELSSALLLALLGGVILNLMPCVFPILSMKALSLLKHAHQAQLETRLHGFSYTAGVLASFAVLGGLLIALKAGGAQIGWGFQFQSPLFVLAVAYLMFAVGLNLSGVFSIGGSVMGIGSSLAERGGYSGSFFTGVLATIVATPCTAPFMGAALGYALAQPPVALMAVLLSLGLGVALPYLLLSNWPPLQRLLPKPGIWMERAKQFLAFPMYGAAAWLVWILAQQAGANATAIALGGMIAIAFASWLYQTTRISSNLARRSGTCIASLTLVVAMVGGYVGIKANAISAAQLSNTTPANDNWEPYSPERLRTLRTEGKPVFLNLTAAWCITCLVNERVALKESTVVDAFRKTGITYLKGDWTNQDDQITKLLGEFGRSGVPLYVVYPHGTNTKPIVLPQILTPEIVLTALQFPSPTTKE